MIYVDNCTELIHSIVGDFLLKIDAIGPISPKILIEIKGDIGTFGDMGTEIIVFVKKRKRAWAF